MDSLNPTRLEWKCGDTFLYRREGLDEHLQIVLSDPSLNRDKVIIANFSELKPYKEQNCIVEIGEHPYITKRSCVPYRFASIMPLALLEDRESRGFIERQQPLSKELLNRVLFGASLSLFMEVDVWDIIENQGLVVPF